MSALELNTLYYGDCLDWMQRWDDQCVDRIYLDGKPWAQGTLFQEDFRCRTPGNRSQ